MSLREYNRLKKQYRAKHGSNPPKGTKLPALRRLMGEGGGTTTRTTTTSRTTSTTSSSRGRSLWNSHYGRGGLR